MIDTTTLRNRLHQRIAAAERAKLTERKKPEAGCDHSWQTFRQTVVPSSERFQGSAAHFIVKGCTKCHGKKTVGYVVEK